MSANATPIETCGRCGHLKSEHAQIRVGGSFVFVCPTALFLADRLQELINEP
jgi:hypothetical protein